MSAILKGKRRITAGTAPRLGRYRGNLPEFWLSLQDGDDPERGAGQVLSCLGNRLLMQTRCVNNCLLEWRLAKFTDSWLFILLLFTDQAMDTGMGMIYGGIFLLGLGLLGASLYSFSSQAKLLRQGHNTLATVVEVRSVAGRDGATYRPIYQYVARKNTTLTYEPSYSSRPSRWQVGDQQRLAYDPQHPAEAVIMTYFGTFGTGIVLLALAAVALILGGGYFVASKFLNVIG